MTDKPDWKQVYGSVKIPGLGSGTWDKMRAEMEASFAHDVSLFLNGSGEHANCPRCQRLAEMRKQDACQRAKDAARIKEIAAFFRQHGREDDAAYIESLPSWDDME